MSSSIRTLTAAEFPPLLAEIPQPPTQLYVRGTLPPTDHVFLCVIGSRKYTTYGKQVVDYLVSGLADYPITIVSGLALGIDSLAHTAALQAEVHTIAVPGSGLDDRVIYPARHKPLARQIIDAGGALLSEFEPTFSATRWSFTQRNRIMAGMCHATLIIEATERSGTLITARLATDYNRELLVVPGDIFSKNSGGVHQFLKLGATPVTTPEDILYALNIEPDTSKTATAPVSNKALSAIEQRVIDVLHEPTDRDTLIRTIDLSSSEANALLMQMEMAGHISSEHNIYRAVI